MLKDLFDDLAGKPFFILSLCVLGYFCVVNLNVFFKVPLVVFFTQLLWFPMLILQIVLLIPAIIYCIIDKFRIDSYSFWSFVFVIVGNLYIFFCLGFLNLKI